MAGGGAGGGEGEEKEKRNAQNERKSTEAKTKESPWKREKSMEAKRTKEKRNAHGVTETFARPFYVLFGHKKTISAKTKLDEAER